MDRANPPFATLVFERPTDLASYLPAAHRTHHDDIIIPQADTNFLADELLVNKINAVQDWLWACGRPMPPRSLHYQVLICREIVITENPELHLMWQKRRIFIKPLPLWLLDPHFWTDYILPNADIAQCARGFLFSYTALLAYESDFRLAQDKGLIPNKDILNWDQWKVIVKEVLGNHDMALVNPRYWYGELRLGRMNIVYRLKGYIFRGYSRVSRHSDYAELLADNFAILGTVLGYVVIVLSSLQVGLGVDQLVESTAFVNFSYGFTVFSILAPVIAIVGIFFVVLAMFSANYIATTKYEQRRFKEMGVEPYWRNEPGTMPKTKPNAHRANSDPKGAAV